MIDFPVPQSSLVSCQLCFLVCQPHFWRPLHTPCFLCNTRDTGRLVCLTRSLFLSSPLQKSIGVSLGAFVAITLELSSEIQTVVQSSSASAQASVWDKMGSPWKGFVEFTLPASPPTAFVSADLSSTSPVGLSLSPYGRSVSQPSHLLLYVPTPDPINTHAPTRPASLLWMA